MKRQEQTAWFGIKIFILNPDLGVYTHVIMNVWFPPNGQLLPAVTLSSFPAEPFEYMSTNVLGAIFAVLWLHLLFKIISSACHACMIKSKMRHVKNGWNWLEWATLMGGFGIFCSWMAFLSQLWSVQDLVLETVEGRPLYRNAYQFEDASLEQTYLDKSADLHRAVARMSVGLMWFRLLITWYVIIIMFRFFRAFLAQPKLAVVTNSVLKSLPDFAHFFIVLCLVMFAYAVAGMFIFGQRLFQFSELLLAFVQCIQIMLGNFDFDELTEEHLYSGTAWFVTYSILVPIIMLNMLLAIVMDRYAEVKGDAEGEDALWTQCYNISVDFYQKKDWVSYRVVEEVLSKWDDCPDKVDSESLMRQLPTIPSDQAVDMIHEADLLIEAQEDAGLGISDALKMVGWIKMAVQKIADKIGEIMVLERAERKLMIEQAKKGAKGGPARLQEDTIDIHPEADHRLLAIDRRLAQMDEFLNESMCFTVHRGKEMRNRLSVIEGLVNGAGELNSTRM